MEKDHGPVHPCFSSEHINVECFGERNSSDFTLGQYLNTNKLSFGEPFSNPKLEERIPFLQMLEASQSPSISPLPNFQLLRLQEQKKLWTKSCNAEIDSGIPPVELESCITNASGSHSPVKSDAREKHSPLSSACPEAISYSKEPIPPANCKDARNSSSTSTWLPERKTRQLVNAAPLRENKKRKRPKPCKNHEEVERQRMTHISVERNRRKQMNSHLAALRSLMPASFIQRGDQASIIGGAIDFVKELEQVLQTLQAKKQTQRKKEEESRLHSASLVSSFFISPQYKTHSPQSHSKFKVDHHFDDEGQCPEFTIKKRTTVAGIEVTVVQMHVNLKILSSRRPGQLLKAIAAFEDLLFIILHLNITSIEKLVLYSFNLKKEEGCKLGSADEIAEAVYQIFCSINSH